MDLAPPTPSLRQVTAPLPAPRVAERVRRLLHENPELEIRFTEAITRDSYYQGPVVLFLHPTHQALVDELRAESR